MKKLYRSETDRFWAGIIGGIGEYFNIDPAVLRVVWIILVVFTGIVPGIVAYIIALAIVPKKEKAHN
jgi:phage shock protein C